MVSNHNQCEKENMLFVLSIESSDPPFSGFGNFPKVGGAYIKHVVGKIPSTTFIKITKKYLFHPGLEVSLTYNSASAT